MCVFEKRTNSTQRRKGAVFGFFLHCQKVSYRFWDLCNNVSQLISDGEHVKKSSCSRFNPKFDTWYIFLVSRPRHTEVALLCPGLFCRSLRTILPKSFFTTTFKLVPHVYVNRLKNIIYYQFHRTSPRNSSLYATTRVIPLTLPSLVVQ